MILPQKHPQTNCHLMIFVAILTKVVLPCSRHGKQVRMVSIAMVALQMFAVGFASDRLDDPYLSGDSSALGVIPTLLTSNSWLIDRTAFGASRPYRNIVQSRQNGTPIRLGQSCSIPPEASTLPSPIYQPIPMIEPIPGTVIPWNQACIPSQLNFSVTTFTAFRNTIGYRRWCTGRNPGTTWFFSVLAAGVARSHCVTMSTIEFEATH